MKTINFKHLGCFGAVAALAAGVMTSVTPNVSYALEMTQNENYAEAIALLADADVESRLTPEEAYSGAEELVTTIKRLELTPDYQKMARLMKALFCQTYDDKVPENYFRCEEKTTNEDVLASLKAVLPESEWGQISDTEDPWSVAWRSVPYFAEFKSIWQDINGVYSVLRSWSTNNLGITPELTTDNIAKIMQKTGDIYWLGGMRLDDSFWNDLELLQANNYTGKIVRLGEKIEDMRWMSLVKAVYQAEMHIGTDMEGYYSNVLSTTLNYYVGNTSYMSVRQKIAEAKDLSDYDLAKLLFDTLNSVCPQIDEDGETVYDGSCFAAIKAAGYTEQQLEAKYNELVRLVSVFDPKAMDGLYDYQLVLADLPNSESNNVVPTAPNTGSADNGELSGVIVKATTTVGIIATLVGIVVTAKRYVFSPLKRNK